MRDKSLTYSQFNIQLEKQVKKVVSYYDDKLLRTAVSDNPKWLLDSEKIGIFYPRDFASVRSLCIAMWSFPEELRWRVLLDLQEKNYSAFNEKQRLEISLLLYSREICYCYLYETERYTARELFGNILGNELKVSLQRLRIKVRRKPKIRRVLRHRGYRDKGSLRPRHQWLENYDQSFTEQQLRKEKNQDLFIQKTHRLRAIVLKKYEAYCRRSNVEKIFLC